jgi:ubiquinone/menaquinone biosynthesis C-methylase UbiE
MVDLTDLFSGTASYYAEYRTPYPEEVFKEIIAEYQLDGTGNLLDLGCGTGEIILPLAGYFDKATGVDINSEMLEMARVRADNSGITNAGWKKLSAEMIEEFSLNFDLITAGNSFHWMDRQAVLQKSYNKLTAQGGMVILAGGSVWNGESEWQNKTVEVIKRYLGKDRRAGSGTYIEEKRHEDFIAESPFELKKKFEVVSHRSRNIEEVLGYLFSTSFSKASLFGNKVHDFQAELTQELLKLNHEGMFKERIETTCFFLKK